MIRQELKRRARAAWKRIVFRIRIHWHAVRVADALHELEDETSAHLWLRGDDRAFHVVKEAQRALLACGRGVKGLD